MGHTGVAGDVNQKIYAQIEEWRQRRSEGEFAYVYVDGIWLKRSWGGEVRNLSVLVAIGVDEEGFRHVLGVSEGTKEDKASRTAFLRELKQRGLRGVRLFINDKCLGYREPGGVLSGGEVGSAGWCTSTVVGTKIRSGKVQDVAAMLKAIHAPSLFLTLN